MATNASTDSTDSRRDDKSIQNDVDAVVSPIRKQLFRSASLDDLDSGVASGGIRSSIDPSATQTNVKDALLSPPPRLPSCFETPIQSNVRKKQTDLDCNVTKFANDSRHESSVSSKIKIGDDNKNDLQRQSLKSVTFDNQNQNMKQDAILHVSNNTNDDTYGQYLSTSDFEESPYRQQHQAISLHNSTAENDAKTGYVLNEKLIQEMQDDFSALSIPELSMEKKEISFPAVTMPGHRRFASLISEISYGSQDENDDDTISDIQRDDSNKIIQFHSDRRISLTVDMETGKSPGETSTKFHRGQQALRRVYSTNMLDAQSPKVRRRRALSHNMDQLRRSFLKLSLPAIKSASDLQKIQSSDASNDGLDRYSIGDVEGSVIPQQHLKQQQKQSPSGLECNNDESLRFTDRKRRNRYNVEQKNVRVLDDKRSFRSQHKYCDEVQYRLSAVTPIELRRRRYKNSINHMPKTGDHVAEDSNKDEHTNQNGIHPESRCNRYLASLGNFVTEFTILVLSKGKQRYSVGWVNRFLYWTFRKNFFVVLMAAACSFYLFTVLFAVCIYLFGRENHECITVNGVNFGETKSQFMDAFALSWTTFSTVGYGLVYPSTTASISENKECWIAMIITTFEAFVGILFSGVWGAICFAKVTRVSSFAQVSFSNGIIIKYGTGVTGVADNDEYEEGSSDDDDPILLASKPYKQSKLPCPIFEFRIANRLHRQRGGEIIDAAINIVASMEEGQHTRTIKNGEGMEAKIRRKGRRPRKSRDLKTNKGKLNGFHDDEDNETISEEKIKEAQSAARTMVASYAFDAAKADKMSFTNSSTRLSGLSDNEDEEHRQSNNSKQSTTPFPNQIFAKLNVESLEHPFFKRVWNVRHVLDITSPLLKPEAKELIRINKGHWPEELNNATAVRASIYFDKILVSFSGTSNVDANSVYSQKVYNFEDMCVGYAFCNMLYRKPDGSIGVDHTLINDVKEQSGGGGEELHMLDLETSNRILPDIFIL